jgi:hypothetical protein
VTSTRSQESDAQHPIITFNGIDNVYDDDADDTQTLRPRNRTSRSPWTRVELRADKMKTVHNSFPPSLTMDGHRKEPSRHELPKHIRSFVCLVFSHLISDL